MSTMKKKVSGRSSLPFNVSVDFSCLLKCLQAGIALGFLTSFLWLLSLMLNGVSDLATY